MPCRTGPDRSLPGPDRAPAPLAEIASAPCDFAPALADAPLALYGAGNLGRLARGYLKVVGRDFIMAIDRKAEAPAREPGWSGVRLVHPDAVNEAAKHDVRLAHVTVCESSRLMCHEDSCGGAPRLNQVRPTRSRTG